MDYRRIHADGNDFGDSSGHSRSATLPAPHRAAPPPARVPIWPAGSATFGHGFHPTKLYNADYGAYIHDDRLSSDHAELRSAGSGNTA
jgi:hypothetical protein